MPLFGATRNESIWRMGIFVHQHRLPRQGRGAGTEFNFYCGCEAFTVKQEVFPMFDVSELYAERDSLLNRLDRKTYAANMELFYQKYDAALGDLLATAEKEGPEASAEQFVKKVADRFSARGNIPLYLQSDLNSFTVYYVLPALDRSGHPMRRALINAICSAWGSRFCRSAIQFAPYDTILNAFQNTFLGIRF